MKDVSLHQKKLGKEKSSDFSMLIVSFSMLKSILCSKSQVNKNLNTLFNILNDRFIMKDVSLHQKKLGKEKCLDFSMLIVSFSMLKLILCIKGWVNKGLNTLFSLFNYSFSKLRMILSIKSLVNKTKTFINDSFSVLRRVSQKHASLLPLTINCWYGKSHVCGKF